MTTQKQLAQAIAEKGQSAALLAALIDHTVVSKSVARSAGIADPNRTVNRLREAGFNIETTTLRNTSLLQGDTYYLASV